MLLKRFFLIFIFILLNNCAYSYSDYDLDNIEYLKYGQNFSYEPLGNRLNRLETDFFGMAQSGNIEDRVYRLSQIAQNSKIQTKVTPQTKEIKRKNIIKNILNSATDIFDSGTMTGFTPSITSYGYGTVPQNIYRNELLNYANNPETYCPYHNRYNINANMPNYYNPYINQRNINPYNHLPPRQFTGNQPINRYYYQNSYYPPNISTGTGVHIIRD